MTSTRTPTKRARACVVATVAAILTLAAAAPALAEGSKPPPAFAHGPRDGLTRALAQGEITPAKYALERALSLFYPAQVSARYGDVERPDQHSATLLLRDLALRADQLSGADRQRATALLARPTDNPNPDDPDNSYGATAEQTPVCGANLCIHYVTSGPHAVAATDTSPANGVPDYVDQALAVFQGTVWGTEVTTMGYRAPKSDVSSDNNGASSANPTGNKFDVYLADIGDDFLYGYCTTDDPNVDLLPGGAFWNVSAYCVVDNDFSAGQFPFNTPLENLQVTAAHEFFHAIQFAYDIGEDQWLMEATATWMEDELYDGVDDNLQYLPDGPLGKPTVPLDRGQTSQSDLHVYGDWIFFRFLSEWFGDPTLDPSVETEDAAIVREIWELADGSTDVNGGQYSIQAVKNALSARGKVFRKVFGKFGWINRVSRSVYDEGFANNYPQAPLTDKMTLSRSAPSRSKSVTLNHQTNRYYEFKRGSGVSSTAKLKLVLDLPGKTTGAFATALVFRSTGVTYYELAITKAGDGTFKVPFGSAISKVDLILTNASTRYSCWWGTVFACQGRSADDGRTYKFTARLA